MQNAPLSNKSTVAHKHTIDPRLSGRPRVIKAVAFADALRNEDVPQGLKINRVGPVVTYLEDYVKARASIEEAKNYIEFSHLFVSWGAELLVSSFRR